MKRFADFLIRAALPFVVTLAWIAVYPMSDAHAASEAQPNIVIIVADELGFSDLGCYGSEIATANLDKLAKGGLRFTQMYSGGRSCPTRAALLTGLYPHQTGIGHMMEDYRFAGYRGNLNKECATLGEILKSSGYQTMMAGKWHLTRFSAAGGPKHNWPTNRGFEKFFGTIHGDVSYFDPFSLCSGETFTTDRGKDFYLTDAIGKYAAEFIEQAAASKKPFFLYVSYPAAHWPLQAPKAAIERYRGKYAAGWDAVRKERFEHLVSLGVVKPHSTPAPRDATVRDWDKNTFKPWQQRRMEVYAAQIDEMDRSIGRILEKLRQRNADRNTLLIFLAAGGASSEELTTKTSGPGVPRSTAAGDVVRIGNDPGVMPGAADVFQSCGVAWANVANVPFRGYAGTTYEGGISTPMIVSWPNRIKNGGIVVSDIGHVVDIVPTCLEVAKVSYPKILAGYSLTPAEGKSLLPLLDGQTRTPPVLFWEHEGNRGMRDGKWKLVGPYNQPWELYDMGSDRAEQKNLAKQYQAIVKDLLEQYDAWAKRVKVEPWNGPK